MTLVYPQGQSSPVVYPPNVGNGTREWVALDGSWITDATENGNLTGVTDFAISGNNVTCAYNLNLTADGLREGMTKRWDPAALWTALGTTEEQIISGEHILLVWVKPTTYFQNVAIFGIGLCDDVAKGSMNGVFSGARGGSSANEHRASAGNQIQDSGAVQGDFATAIGMGTLGHLHMISSDIPVAVCIGFDAGLTEVASRQAAAGSAMGASPNIRLCLFAGTSVSGSGAATIGADVWFAIEKFDGSGLPV